MSHLDPAEFQRFCKEKFILAFNMVLTLYSVVCMSLENSPTKQTSNTLRMYVLVYY